MNSILLRPAPIPRISAPRDRALPSAPRCNADNSSGNGSDPIVNEDVLARLRKFEEENAKLRDQLSEQDTEGPASQPKAARIDGGSMRRESLFTDKSQAKNWISESDVDFFTGGGVGETGDGKVSPEESAEVTKRVILGLIATVVVGGLALVPTEQLDGAATKPLPFYLVPVLRSISLLEDLEVELEEGSLDKVPLVIDRVLNRPNDARKNMYSAIEFIQSNGTGVTKQTARETVSSFVDYVQQADYNKYFDNLQGKAINGRQAAEFQQFSLKSIQAAQKSGKQFLSFFPPSEVQKARDLILPPSE